MTRPATYLLGLLVCGVAAPAAAALPDKGPLSTERCPQLFGTEQSHRRNRAFRERFLRWALKDPAGITVAHSNQRWEAVTRLELSGLSLEQREGDTLVSISPELADRVGCATGRYLLERDDSIGRRTRALAVFGDVVLVAYQGRLAFISAPGAPSPRWLLGWQLRGVTVPRVYVSGARPAPRRAPPRSKPRPKPRRRR